MTDQDGEQSLEGLVYIEPWWRLADALRDATLDPTRFGFRHAKQVLDEVARLRGQSRRTLEKLLDARAIAARADMVLDENAGVGPQHLFAYRRLQLTDPDQAEIMKDRVCLGVVTVSTLNKLAAAAEKKGAGKPLSLLRRRAADFAAAAMDAVQRTMETRFGSVVLEQVQIPLEGEIDLVVRSPAGEDLAAIAFRAGHGHMPISRLRDMLARLALAQRRYPEVWLVVPPEWENTLGLIKQMSGDLGLDGLFFAIADPESAGPLSVIE